jgi:hypothetical protein
VVAAIALRSRCPVCELYEEAPGAGLRPSETHSGLGELDTQDRQLPEVEHALGHRLQVDGRQRLDLLLREVDADLLIPASHRTDRNCDLLAAP